MSTLRNRGGGGKVVDLDPSSSNDATSSTTRWLGPDGRPLPTFTPSNFTAKELLASIPPHCFERSFIRSTLCLGLDLVMMAGLTYTALNYIDPSVPSGFPGIKNVVSGVVENVLGLQGLGQTVGEVARWAAWATYWYLAGLVGTGIWVIAHECGHQAYCDSKLVNNTIGFILHSALLVPFHSWRISHGRHHSATGHMTRDQVFVPKTRLQRHPGTKAPTATLVNGPGGESFYQRVDELLEDAPLWGFITTVGQQLIGWPAYILIGASGPATYPKWTSHFDPSSAIFEPRHRNQIILSDLGILTTLTLLSFWGQNRGFAEVVKMYLMPYLWVNHWLVLITYLQHTDPLLPHYRGSEWNFQRGALTTVDRNIHGWFFHGIAETHVAHHLASKIPHYHAWEATEALKKKLGVHYIKSEENYWVSLLKSAKECKFVEDDGDIIFYKNGKGQSHITLAYEPPVSDSGVDVQ